MDPVGCCAIGSFFMLESNIDMPMLFVYLLKILLK